MHLQLRSCFIPLVLIALAYLSPRDTLAQVSSAICLTEDDGQGIASTGSNEIAFEDSVRALVVLVRFSDDDVDSSPAFP